MSEQLVATKLWPHQLETVSKFERIPRELLGWSMGTGKTLGSIETDLRFRSQYSSHGTARPFRTLVVTPLAVQPGWVTTLQREAEPFLGRDPQVMRMNPKKRDLFFKPGYDYYLMHWDALLKLVDRFGKAKRIRPIEVVRELGFSHIILDEIHRAKNRETKRTVAANHMEIRLMTGLSGSLVPNKPQDIWSPLHMMYPRVFHSYWDFVFAYMETEKIDPGDPESEYFRGDTEARPYIQIHGPNDHWIEAREELIGGFVSIIEDEDLPYLNIPQTIPNTIECELGAKQRKLYDGMDKDMLAWVNSNIDPDNPSPLAANAIISKLIRLQQFAIGSMIEVLSGNFRMGLPAAKLEAIKEWTQRTDESIVIFSQFSQPLALLQQMMPDDVLTYTGEIQSQKTREANLEAFKAGAIKILGMTYGAGGEGIDGLQYGCRNVIMLDRAWAPEVNRQAIGRVRRAGQKYPVNVIDVVARKTIDDWRNHKIAYKGIINRRMLGLK